jgi:hypothetical protein
MRLWAAQTEESWCVVATLLTACVAASSGWRLVGQLELPRQNAAGQSIGGFSAVSCRSHGDQLCLLSDLPNGRISIWSGLAREQPPRPVFDLPLGRRLPGDGRPPVLDGEAMVLLANRIWLSREGRRSTERPAEPLAFDARSGAQTLRVPLPDALAARIGKRGMPPLQAPQDRVRPLRDVRLLALLPRFIAPNSWQNRLALYPLPGSHSVQKAEREWDLQSLGLIPDNWEGLSPGPARADGTPTLVLISDDNLNRLLANRLALLATECGTGCVPLPR